MDKDVGTQFRPSKLKCLAPQRTCRAVNAFCRILFEWIQCHYRSISQLRECTTPRVNPDVNYGCG